ncbi:MAG: class I SAM-dependent methyltransferase [bacterium]
MNIHPITWTEEKINDFWNYMSKSKSANDKYFSKEVGNEIINLALKYSKLDGKILDYGCGTGFLIGYLIDKGISCSGIDSSVKSLDLINEKFKNNKLFKGAILAKDFPLPIKNDSFDFIFFVETIEHILPEKREVLLREFHKILKKNGKILVTTPNNENLDKNKNFCPECGCVFHRMQHVDYFDEKKLSNLLNEAGFNRLFCKGLILPKDNKEKIKLFVKKTLRLNYKKPHLVYVGIKI